MAQLPRAAAEIRDFGGLVNNVDPRDLEDGMAEVQINCCSILLGELTVRRGLLEVSFEES